MRLRHVVLLVLIVAGLVTSGQPGSAAGQSPGRAGELFRGSNTRPSRWPTD